MPTLLRLDASARRHGSCSRALADHFQQRWCAAHPGGRVVVRDLALDPVPHLDAAAIRAFQAHSANDSAALPHAALGLSNALIAELKSADCLLIGSPLYNFGAPSTLKAYCDHVVRAGCTFDYTPRGFAGLVTGRRAFVIAARGGPAEAGEGDEHLAPFLERVLRFIGFTAIDRIEVAGTAGEAAAREAALLAARHKIDDLLAVLSPESIPEPEWRGAFTAADRREIAALRRGQAHAIEAGDAAAYARLCAEDIHLLIPGHELTVGRPAFLARQENLFRATKFPPLHKRPLRVERGGDLAVEVGVQELQRPDSAAGPGVFSRRQKYTHVFRLTPDGWRFAVLMSNPSE